MAEGLPWYRTDSNWPTHDKIIDLAGVGPKGKAAGFVYHASIAWAQGHGTDGVIKRSVLPFIHGTAADAKLLVEHRLWDEHADGWVIHNFADRNPVGAIAQGIEDDLSDARSAAGRAGAAARWGGKK